MAETRGEVQAWGVVWREVARDGPCGLSRGHGALPHRLRAHVARQGRLQAIRAQNRIEAPESSQSVPQDAPVLPLLADQAIEPTPVLPQGGEADSRAGGVP